MKLSTDRDRRKRRFVMWGEAYSWYGPTFTCCACGEEWDEEGRSPRPFEPGWRKANIARARQGWAAGVTRAEWWRLGREKYERERALIAGSPRKED